MYKLITQLGVNYFNVEFINEDKYVLKPGEDERIRKEQANIYLVGFNTKDFSFSGRQLRYLMSLFNVSIHDICFALNIDDSSKIKMCLNSNSIIAKENNNVFLK